MALDQRLAIVENQRRHADQGIVGLQFFGIAEDRPRPLLEGNPIQRQRNADAPHERRIILADEDHRKTPNLRSLARRMAEPEPENAPAVNSTPDATSRRVGERPESVKVNALEEPAMAYLIIGIVIMLGMHFFGMFAPAARGGS